MGAAVTQLVSTPVLSPQIVCRTWHVSVKHVHLSQWSEVTMQWESLCGFQVWRFRLQYKVISYLVWRWHLHKLEVRDKLLSLLPSWTPLPTPKPSLIAARYPQGSCSECLYETVRAIMCFRLHMSFLAAVHSKGQCHATVLLCVCHGVTCHPKL